MPTSKAQYKGPTRVPALDFSDNLRRELQKFAPTSHEDHFGDEDTIFTEAVLAAARYGLTRVRAYRLSDVSNDELRAEQGDLALILSSAQNKLRSLTPAFSRHLGVAADPLGTADKIGELLAMIELASVRIQALERKESAPTAIDEIATEMTVRVLHVLRQYGISPASTSDSDLETTSIAVAILRLIGGEIGVQQSSRTWRDRISRAKARSPTLL